MTVLSEKMKSSVMLNVLKEHLDNPELTVQEAYNLIKDSPVRNMHISDFLSFFGEVTNKVIPLKGPTCETLGEKNVSNIITKKWEDWPSEVQREILYVLEQNDLGKRKVTMKDYLKRLIKEHDLDVTEHSLKTFCKDHGRRGWSC